MSLRYRNIFPLSQQPNYNPNDNIDLLLNLEGEKLLPGTVTLEGSLEVYSGPSTSKVHATGGTRIYYDPLVGAHGIIRDATVEYQMMGITENFQNYPRLVKMKRLALTYDESLGSETSNCLELTVQNEKQAAGMLQGQADGAGADYTLPFSLKLMNSLNSASAPISSSSTGQVRLRLRLAPANEFLYGEDMATASWTYTITDLRLRYQTIPDDGKKQQVQIEVYHNYRTLLDSTNTNISTFVPGLAMASQISFIRQSDENDPNQNYLACQPPPGQPPIGSSDELTKFDYGVERLYYAINDTDTALVGWTLESREEILLNGLRAFGGGMAKFGALLRRMQNCATKRADGYIAGIPFGGLLDFSRNKFAAQLETQCDNANELFAIYIFFPMIMTITA